MKPERSRVIPWLIIGLSTSLLNSGCALVLVGGAAAAAGVGVFAYVKGELKSTEAAPLGRTWSATQRAMKDLELSVTTQEKDGFAAKLVALGTGDKTIEVKLKRVTANQTDVGIRVGVFGDEAMSRRILEAIRKRL